MSWYILCCSSYFVISWVSEWVSEVAQSCPTFYDPMDCSLPGSSVYGILQARVLEWVAISFSRGSSQPRDRTRVSCIPGRCYNFIFSLFNVISLARRFFFFFLNISYLFTIIFLFIIFLFLLLFLLFPWFAWGVLVLLFLGFWGWMFRLLIWHFSFIFNIWILNHKWSFQL